MRKLIIAVSLTLFALVLWTGVIVGGIVEGWWRQPLAPRGDTRAFADAAESEVDRHSKGNAAFVLLEHGKVAAQHFRSVGKPVDGDTLFQVASLSKLVTAWGVMTLVESGRIDLDAPVSKYLKRWQLPASKFDNNGVTVRRLLSHTAGLTDGLGYAGFAPGHKIQTLEESLTATADVSAGKGGLVRVGSAPGGEFQYSGGGYTLLQLLIEDVTGQRFNDYMKQAVLEPLHMTNSTYVLPETGGAKVAEFYDVDGKPATHYRFTAVAAASLYTSTSDLTALLQGYMPGPHGEPEGRGVLQPATLREMRKPQVYQYGAAIWGLGTILYAENNEGGFIIGHDGNNDPAINTTARIDPASGDGIVLLETGNALMATQIAGEWVFWRTGNVDTFMVLMDMRQMFPLLAGGWAVIVLAAIFLGWRMRRKSARMEPLRP